MAANPAIVECATGERMPAPFANEAFVLRRPGCGFEVDGVRTRSGKWATTGSVFLSNIRLVFLADRPDASGLAGFDIPLVYISNDKLNQPIFGCNNLSGRVWPATEGGGPAGGLPPHEWRVNFKSGGIGTVWPMYYALVARARRAEAAVKQPAEVVEEITKMAQTAFVDPNDPTTIYLTQPVGEGQRLQEQPRYASNYGADEAYEPIDAAAQAQAPARR